MWWGAAVQEGTDAAGTFLQIAGAIRQGQSAAAEARFNARQKAAQSETEARLAERRAQVAENDVLAEQQALAFDVQTRRKEFARQFAKRRAAIGAAGLEYTGSSLLVAIDEARQAELDVEAMQWESERKQAGLSDEASMERFQAEELRKGIPVALGIGERTAKIAKEEAIYKAIALKLEHSGRIASRWGGTTLMSGGGGGGGFAGG